MLPEPEIQKFRTRFPILQQRIYLYNCSQGALSDAVDGAIREYAASWRTSAAPWDEWVGVYEALRSEFARFIHASPEEVAIVFSASAGINPIASALSFTQRNRVVMSEYEFPTMGHIWLAQQPRGAQVQFLNGIGNAVPAECYRAAIDERTAIVPLTQVSFLNGFRSDVAAVTRIAHDHGALVFLDAYQDCGTRPVDVKALDVDFFVTGALKYLLGPPGIAFLYVRRELIESLTPTMTSWMSQRDVFAFRTTHLDPSPHARRFECGTPAIPNIYLARAALQLLAGVGMENVAAQIEQLSRAFLAGATALGIAAKTSADTVGPLIVLRSTDSAAVVAKLAARSILTSARLDGVRFAFHVYNTMDDVDTALGALKDNLELMVRA
ncbi:MAG: aminotransferase class V-fold PLP-dependent enzyme [Candidatus Sulfopaludibacter sp.]|nr:aminotransferase class V-fold PLP-dependent enzyme [Candidatus Sulfopaludibacter sp.]